MLAGEVSRTAKGTPTPRLPARLERIGDLPFATAIALLMALATQLAMGGVIGFDDANITMNYAANLAGGHGYVYYVGGERVEGSTSPLWTAVNVVPFLIGVPVEPWLAGVGLAISAIVIVATLRLARLAACAAGVGEAGIRWWVALSWLSWPGFFGWTTWSYMDTGLWILLNTLLFLAVAEGASSGKWRPGRFVLLTALLACCRPEGVAFVGIFAAIVAAILVVDRRRDAFLVPVAMLAASVASLACLTSARLAYFGYPVPNTFYAKVSTNFIDQLGLGIDYTLGYLSSPQTILFFLGAAALFRVVARNGVGGGIMLLWAAPFVLAVFALSVYTILGGDHFGSHRFYQVLTPLLAAGSAAAVCWAVGRGLVRRISAAAAMLALGAIAWGDFARTSGGFTMSLAMAQHGRDVGRVVESWPGRPSIAVIPAGGVAMTYSGPIYDLMGLNWVEMAMAGRDAVTEYKNHGGFDRSVFFRTLPDIVDPHFAPCDEQAIRDSRVTRVMLDDLFNDPDFHALYRFACRDGLVFYERI